MIAFCISGSISIHAPTKGATTLYDMYDYYRTISIHAPTKGATPVYVEVNGSTLISIHAPTKGATQNTDDPDAEIRISIHAPTKGATISRYIFYRNIGFQSTLPRRERQCNRSHLLGNCYFNPRSHEGSDNYEVEMKMHARDFNPRSHEGSDNC